MQNIASQVHISLAYWKTDIASILTTGKTLTSLSRYARIIKALFSNLCQRMIEPEFTYGLYSLPGCDNNVLCLCRLETVKLAGHWVTC